ncbi:protein-glutamate O-methyltransferase CheR [Pseudogemmatithrix spongiicola]|uniref:protein-glutamate O-methyltransferase n=1 Tax=Pseudogemmatithrix spongiicola TaxID=3062599 RepID=A0AA49JZZ6_9BACT|nr:protein-glutamate O-methyltransferase CheR [Gemmatimonadaceae bacterium 'strain 138']WKW14897.1 protein-glutamate O-methyltransferase CheR [Gemmatimonadaceae bacterium 'strain 318']
MSMAAGEDEAAFKALLEQVARERGFACANYKDGCLRRRVAVRMRARGSESFAAYAALLRREPDEYERLMDTLTINVTRLYRDADVWDAVADAVLPALWQANPEGLGVWSAGCASGEELFTLAALLHRHAERTATLPRLRDTQVLGSDIDAASLQAARTGRFAEAAFKEMPAALRDRYFVGTGTRTAVAELQALVRVERRDLLMDPPPPMVFDLIACRNMLIYIDREGQERIFRRFHAALAPHGILVLGKVETMLGPARSLFAPVHPRQRIFRKVA